MKIQGCDRKCKSCPLLELCGGIEQYSIKGYRCYQADCRLKAPAIKRMQECHICHIGKKTWDLTDEVVRKLVSEVESLSKVSSRPIELPGVVPLVSLKDPASYRFDPIDVAAIVVMFEDLFDEEIRNAIEKAGNIHTYLNFDGKVLASSIMPDDLITREDVFYFFMNVMNKVKFDGAIAWDAPVYIDIPLYDSWVNLLMGLKLTHELADCGVPVYGLAKGNLEKQIKFSIETLAKINIDSMALHASEYMVSFNDDSTVRQVVYSYFNHFAELAKSVLIVGALSPKWLSFMKSDFPKGPRLSVAGLSWFLDAKRGLLYSDGGRVDTTGKYVECKCATCSKVKSQDLMDDLGARARHNLSYLITNVDNPSAAPLQLSTCDLLLEEGEKALLISDIHIWSSRELLDNFLAFLREEKPTHIVFLGDVIDLKGRPDLQGTRAFFMVLRELGSLVFVVKGCSNSDQDDFLSAMDKLTMAQRVKPTLWSKEDDQHLAQTYLDLYRFHRGAKDQLVMKLADGSFVVAEHGHDVIGDVTSPLKSIVEQLEEARRRAHARWLIVGHLHRPFLDGEKRVASTGCWAFDDEHETLRTRREDLMAYVVVHGNGKVELKRRG